RGRYGGEEEEVEVEVEEGEFPAYSPEGAEGGSAPQGWESPRAPATPERRQATPERPERREATPERREATPERREATPERREPPPTPAPAPAAPVPQTPYSEVQFGDSRMTPAAAPAAPGLSREDLDSALAQVSDALRADVLSAVTSLHVDMIRGLQQASDELREMEGRFREKVDRVEEENRKLRVENDLLKGLQ
ncbi:hypothetical protein TeGR_g10970, partial [Tetraparma gracilis]